MLYKSVKQCCTSRIKRLIITISLSLFSPYIVLAAVPDPTAGKALGEYGGTTLLAFLEKIQNYLLGFSGALAVLFIVIGGIMYMTAAGNEKRVGVAKQTLTYAIGGLVVVLLSWVILTVIANVFIGNLFTPK